MLVVDATCSADTVFVRATIARTVPCATCAAAATSRCARPTRHARTTACSYSWSASRLRPAARSTRRSSSLPSSSRARPWLSPLGVRDRRQPAPSCVLRGPPPRRSVAGEVRTRRDHHRSWPAARSAAAVVIASSSPAGSTSSLLPHLHRTPSIAAASARRSVMIETNTRFHFAPHGQEPSTSAHAPTIRPTGSRRPRPYARNP